MTAQTRVAVVEDHTFMREGLRVMLQSHSDFELIAEAGSAEEARAEIERTEPDIALVDLHLGADEGIEVVKWLREKHPAVRVLVVSMQEEALYAERMLRLGVSGYVMKTAASTDLLDALRKVAKGQRHLSVEMSGRLLQQQQVRPRRGKPERPTDPVQALTHRELAVFKLIGAGVNTREIARRLGIAMKTVDAHRTRVRERLNLKTYSELVRYATSWVAEQPD